MLVALSVRRAQGRELVDTEPLQDAMTVAGGTPTSGNLLASVALPAQSLDDRARGWLCLAWQ
jgi:hypothetical protein